MYDTNQVPPEMSRPRTMEELKLGDCWSIGVIAYILIAGRPPFGGKNQKDIFSNICDKKKKLRFPKKVTASFKSFIRSLLSRDIKQRMTAAQALDHPWIAGDGASTDHLHVSYLESLQKFNRGNKLQNIMVNACIQRANTKDKQAMEKGLIDLTRSHTQMRDSDVVDYLLLHTKVTERAVSYKEEVELDNSNDEEKTVHQGSTEKQPADKDFKERMIAVVDNVVDSLGNATFWTPDSPEPATRTVVTVPSKVHSSNDVVSLEHMPRPQSMRVNSDPFPRRVEASEENILTRKISEHRFSAIMKATPYDATALIADLADADGMIALDEIAHYHMDVENESDLESESESESKSDDL